MTDSDIDLLINSFKDANKALRKRAVSIAVLMFLTLGLLYLHNDTWDKIDSLWNYQQQLEGLLKLNDSTFRRTIDSGDGESIIPIRGCVTCPERYKLFESVKTSNYNKKPIEAAIYDIDTQVSAIEEDKQINILGFSIPIKPLYYVFFIIILVLFHDFTQVILFRKRIYQKMKIWDIPDWKMGFELFGTHEYSNKQASRFIRFISSTLTGVAILMPLVASILFIKIPNSLNAGNMILFVINLACLAFIIIDTIIIFYTDNLWHFRIMRNVYLGNYKMTKMELTKLWSSLMGFFLLIRFAYTFFDNQETLIYQCLYLLISVTPMVLTCLIIVITHRKYSRGMVILRTIFITTTCFFSVLLFISEKHFLIDGRIDFYKLLELLIVSLGIAMLSSIVYVDYFSAYRRKKIN
jgi:hypothetical protein